MANFDRTATARSLSEAMTLAAQGLPCFPCQVDKSPATPHGFKDASCDPVVLRQLWRFHPGPLVGVPTGEFSHLDVLDIDLRHAGENWYARHRQFLPQTRVHRTRGGGLHLLFRHLPGVRCSAGRIAAGVDVRATGGYVIWWPAAGFSVLSDVQLARWPAWLQALLLPPPRSAPPRAVVPDDATLTRLIRLIAGGHAGERNNLTFWAACRAGEMVASGLLRADTAAALIAEAATRTGLPLAEAERTAWSGIRAGRGLSHA